MIQLNGFEMKPKQKRNSNWERDMNGRPVNRAKAWGERKTKDARKSRKAWRSGGEKTHDV